MYFPVLTVFHLYFSEKKAAQKQSFVSVYKFTRTTLTLVWKFNTSFNSNQGQRGEGHIKKKRMVKSCLLYMRREREVLLFIFFFLKLMNKEMKSTIIHIRKYTRQMTMNETSNPNGLSKHCKRNQNKTLIQFV